jgi:hypothetical protein
MPKTFFGLGKTFKIGQKIIEFVPKRPLPDLGTFPC